MAASTLWKFKIAAGCHAGFFNMQCIAYIAANKILKKTSKFGDSSRNRMNVMGNKKIQDGDWQPFWIWKCAIYIIDCRKSNTEESIKFGDSSCNGLKVMLNFQNRREQLAASWFLIFTVYCLNERKWNCFRNKLLQFADSRKIRMKVIGN